MKTISDEEYVEYQNLLSQRNFDSVKAITNLRDDIDKPIRHVVAMFALLGCNPLFSCCGFDYDGQPIHKTHEYGNVYFILTPNDKTKNVITYLVGNGVLVQDDEKTTGWVLLSVSNAFILRSAFIRYYEKISYPWVANKTCIHYSEGAILNIQILAEHLEKLSDQFLDQVVLEDTNYVYKTNRNLPNWQYPSLEPWIVTKEDTIFS